MKKILACTALLCAWGLVAPSRGSGEKTRWFHLCQINNGQVFSCDGEWYQGKAVVLHDGAYHSCQINNGQVFSCDGDWYQGKAVVLHDRAYHSCQINNGQVFSCDGDWYQGKAVVDIDR